MYCNKTKTKWKKVEKLETDRKEINHFKIWRTLTNKWDTNNQGQISKDYASIIRKNPSGLKNVWKDYP